MNSLFIFRRRIPLFLVCIVALAASAFSLWLVSSWLKYVFFVAESIAIVLMYSILTNYEFSSIRLARLCALGTRFSSIIPILLPIFGIALIVLNFLHPETSILQQVLTMMVTSVLPGYIILRISGVNAFLTKVEVTVMSVIISFVFSGSLNLLMLPIQPELKGPIILLAFILLGCIGLLPRFKNSSANRHSEIQEKNKINHSDILAIIFSLSFYLLVFCLLYPDVSLLPNADIARHYRSAIILSNTPEFYVNSAYALFHAYESTVNLLSGGPQIKDFQSMLVPMNLMLPLSIYVISRRFLGHIDARIAPLSTLFYVFLSNYSFIYYTKLRLANVSGLEFSLLSGNVAEKTFNGTINFLQPFVFFVPLSISLVIFVVSLSLLKNNYMSRFKFITLLSVLILSMYMIHVTEAVIFTFLLALYAFATRGIGLRLNDSLISSVIGLGLSTIFILFSGYFLGLELRKAEFRVDLLLTAIIPFFVNIAAIIYRNKFYGKARLSLKISSKHYSLLSILIASMYLGSFATWLFDTGFQTSAVYDIGVVPWFVFPLMLGTAGILSILSIKYIPSNDTGNTMRLILLTIGFLFLMGRLLSFINLNYFVTGYWEKRFIFFIFLFSCLLAPIPLIRFYERFNITKVRFKGITIICFISVIVLSGYSSIILQTEYLYLGSIVYKINSKELDAVTYLRNILSHDPRAFVVGFSKRSIDVLTFSAPSYIFSKPDILLTSQRPEVGMFSLNAHNLPHSYIYLHARDLEFLQQQKDSWFSNHLLNQLPIVFFNGEVTILNATSTNFPSDRARVNFIIPSQSFENSWFYSYDVLGGSRLNYTTFYDSDQNALSSDTVILSYDPKESSKYYTAFQDMSNWHIVSGIWNETSTGLQGGDTSNGLNRLILSPISAKYFSSTTLIENPTVTKDKIARYSSIVFSYADSNNYRSADLIIYNGQTYLSLGNVQNGSRTWYPPWPGKLVNESSSPNSINLTVSVSPSSEDIILNGTKYISRAVQAKSGNIGLEYGRHKDIKFENFTVNSNDASSPRALSEYMEFVANGGHLIVLNPNGYGQLMEYINASERQMTNKQLLFNVTSSNQKMGQLEDSGGTKGDGLNIVEPKHIFFGKGVVSYYDIFPLVFGKTEKEISDSRFHDLLAGEYFLHGSPLLTSQQKSYKDVNAMFKSVNATGSVNVNSDSLLIPQDILFHKITMKNETMNLVLNNVTIQEIEGYSGTNLKSENIDVREGSGMYAKMFFESGAVSIIIEFKPHATIHFSSLGGDYSLTNISSLSLTPYSPYFINVRNPNMQLSGTSQFDKFYSGQLFSKTGVDGQGLKVLGNISMNILLSDQYTLVDKLNAVGSLERVPPLSQFDEIGSLQLPPFLASIYSLPVQIRLLITIPFVIVLVIYLNDRAKRKAGHLVDSK